MEEVLLTTENSTLSNNNGASSIIKIVGGNVEFADNNSVFKANVGKWSVLTIILDSGNLIANNDDDDSAHLYFTSATTSIEGRNIWLNGDSRLTSVPSSK